MLTPIEFSNLYNKKWTEEFNLVSNTQLKDTWEVLATAFNDCIELNKKGEVNRLVVPMPTGSGKSTGLELYLQNLDKSITALVVVYFIETADELEKRINEVNPNSAIAVHSKNENTINDSNNYQILIVTHQHFINRMDEYHLDRDLVVIDESIDLLNETNIKQYDLNRIRTLIQSRMMTTPNLKKELDYIERYEGLLKACYSQMQKWQEDYKDILKTSKSEFLVDNCHITDTDNFTFTKSLIKNNSCSQILSGKRASIISEQELKQELLSVIEGMESFLEEWFYYYGTNLDTASLNKASIKLPNQSVVILDATSTTNYLYKLFKDVKLYDIDSSVRNYSNVTLSIAKGIKTGKSSMVGVNSEESTTKITTAKNLIDNLISLESLNESSKVLIVTHKELESYLLSFETPFEYDVNHFGNLTGKNDWQEYDTVVIYGLMHKPKPFVLNRHAVSVSPDNAVAGNDKDLEIRSLIESTDLASEVIQAINRVRCRNVVDESGNCLATSIYMTLPNGAIGDTIIKEITSKMSNINVIDWDFETTNLSRTSSKKSNRLDEVVSYISNNVDSYEYLEASKVKSDIDIAPTTFNDLIKKDYFKDELDKHKILIETSPTNSRQKVFVRDKS